MAENRIGESNILDRSHLAGLTYDVRLRVHVQDGGMDHPEQRRWKLNEAIYAAHGHVGPTGSSCELGDYFEFRFRVRSPSQFDAIRDACEVVGTALEAARIAPRAHLLAEAAPVPRPLDPTPALTQETKP